MYVLILGTFMQRETVLLFPCYLAGKTYEINKRIYGVFILIVSS